MKQLNDKISDVREQHADAVIVESQAEVAEQRRTRSLVLTGALKAGASISQTINKQTIKLLQEFRDNKDFEALGYSRFDDYLNEFEFSPMSYRQFNEMEKLLTKEGDDLFTVFTLSGISQRKRLLLGKGDVEFDGEVVIVRHKTVKHKKGDDGEDVEDVQVREERISVDDREALLHAITELTDRTNKQSKKIADQGKRLKVGEEEFQELKRKKSVTADRDELDETCGIAIAALGDLDRLLQSADRGRVEWFIKQNYRFLTARYALVNSTLTELVPDIDLAQAGAADDADSIAAMLEED